MGLRSKNHLRTRAHLLPYPRSAAEPRRSTSAWSNCRACRAQYLAPSALNSGHPDIWQGLAGAFGIVLEICTLAGDGALCAHYRCTRI